MAPLHSSLTQEVLNPPRQNDNKQKKLWALNPVSLGDKGAAGGKVTKGQIKYVVGKTYNVCHMASGRQIYASPPAVTQPRRAHTPQINCQLPFINWSASVQILALL